MLNETLLLQFSERGEWLSKWLVFRSGESAEPEIYNLERIEAQVAQIVMYGIDNLLPRACVKPGTVGAAASADFGHDHQVIGIRMQRLLNDLIGDMRTVEIAGIDMIHARCHSLAQNRDRAWNIAWWAPNLLIAILSGELHGPITDPVNSQRCARERKTATEIRLLFHFVSLPALLSEKFKKTLRPVPRSFSTAPQRCADRARTPERLH